ncbi:MAG: DNA translocase FtsK [Acidimicrobiia bacterium]|nr:DNA translocase FtsK [Acidimicrobiia bacterium]
MATRTASRASTRSSSKRSTTKKPTKRAPAKRRSAPPPTRSERAREAARRELGGHGADALAVGLLVLAALTTLGLVSDLAGPVGRGLNDGFGSLLGRARYAVPVVCVVFAILLFSRRPAARRAAEAEEAGEDAPNEPAPLRVGVGFALLGIAAVGALHLAFDRPSIDGPARALRDAGGIVGATIGGPLATAAGTVGAAIVLGGLAVLGALLAPGVPMSDVMSGLGRTVLRAGGHVGTHARKFSDLAGPPDEELDGDPLDDLPGDLPDDVPGDLPGELPGDLVDLDLTDPAAAASDVFPVAPVFDPTLAPEGALEPDGGPETGMALPAVSLYDVEADGIGDPQMARADEPTLTDLPPVVVEDDGQTALDLGPKAGKGRKMGVWKLPAKALLKKGDAQPTDQRLMEEGGKVLQSALRQHGVDAKLIGMTVGPTVTRYELELAPGVKVNRVTGLSHDIAYAMASPDVRILAPIPGRSAIGVEVPNKARQLVTLGDVLMSPEAKAATHPLEVGLGRDIAGRSVMLNLATLPHVLIAGATGSGKSSCINSLVTSLLMRCTPDQVRLILVDPKRVELGAYNDVPHLLTPVVTNPKKAANALEWAVREMDMRYETLAEVGVRDITGYNAMVDRGELPTPDEPDPISGKGYERLPFIVIVVDELNDLMMVAARDVESSVCRIAQMARAVGIHLVIATQRPSVDVITGVIKANVPSRLAFSVSSLADSRVILDQAGAEKLIGQGDLLALTASSSRAQRIQCAWVDEECVRKVAAHWKRQATEPLYAEGIVDETGGGAGGSAGSDDDDDPLLVDAMELVVRGGLGSTSMLQRKLRVGFARAGRLMDILERKGVVGPSTGSKARDVLMTVEELEAMQQRGAEA